MTGIPIFLSSDNNYAPYVASAIASICNNTDSFCDFYILDGGITEENRKKIELLKLKFQNFSIEFIKIDVEKYFKDFPVCKYFSKSMYSRFLIPKLKPGLNRAIYSDVDIVALGDIKKMFEENLDKYLLGAVWEEYTDDTINKERKQRLGLSDNHKYFSSGNLLINCKKWRNENIFEKLTELVKKHRNIITCPDQDVLNLCFENNYKQLKPIYCWLNGLYDFYNGASDIIIRHFNGTIKPWNIAENIPENNMLPFLRDKNIFWKYAKTTRFYDEILEKIQYRTGQSLNKFLVYKLMEKRTHTKGKIN